MRIRFVTAAIWIGWAVVLPMTASVEEDLAKLIQEKKYTLALERSEAALNTEWKSLSPAGQAAVLFARGQALIGLHRIEPAREAWTRLEKEFPTSPFLPEAWLALAESAGDDVYRRQIYLRRTLTSAAPPALRAKAAVILAQDLYEVGNFQEAAVALGLAAQAVPSIERQPSILMLRAMVRAGLGDPTGAHGLLQRALKGEPGLLAAAPERLLAAGRIYLNAGQYQAAQDTLIRLFNVYPSSPWARRGLVYLAQTLEKRGHHYLAAIFLIQGIRSDTDPQSLYSIYLQLGRITSLLPGEDLDAITHHFPRFTSAPALLAEVEHNAPDYNDRREAAMLTADALRSQGRSTDAMEHLMRFLGRTRDPVVEQVFQHRFDEFMAQARQEGRYASFLRLWASLKDWKSYLTGPQLLAIGETLLSLDLTDKAVEVFSFLRRYQLYRGVWDEAGKGLIRATFTKGEWADCLAQIEAGFPDRLQPESEFLYYRLRCAEKLDRPVWKEPLRQIEPPKTFDRFDVELQLMRGELFVRENRIGQAIEVYQAVDRVPALAPERRRAVVQRLADLHYLGGDLAKALPAYRRLDEIGGESDWSLYQQTLALRALGRTEEADRTAERLKTRYPQSPWTKRTP